MSGAAQEKEENGLVKIVMEVNGQTAEAVVEPLTSLLGFLRDHLGLTGTRFGCLAGHCGACTVLVNGRAAKSCLVLAASCNGGSVTTVEGLRRDGRLNRVQQVFVDEFAFQCGYCTPGLIMTVVDLLQQGVDGLDINEENVRSWIAGNLCRCTGYHNIVKAVAAVVTKVKDVAE